MLEKSESRKRWGELRDLWNKFDPIGVMQDMDWPRDEYEAYCGPTMRLLETGGEAAELEAYVRSTIGYMGLKASDYDIKDFVETLQSWFRKSWQGTSV